MYKSAGDHTLALALFRKAIAVADLVAAPDTAWHRAETRIEAAVELALLGQFDEAETLGEDALAMHQIMRTPMPSFEQQLAQIRQMKQTAAGMAVRSVKQ